MRFRKNYLSVICCCLFLLPFRCGVRPGAGEAPNILVIFGDDIGQANISAFTKGLMGYRTPNIDRLAKEGMTLHRLLRGAELHGRAVSFITGQCVFRTGLSKVGLPAAAGRACTRKTRPSPRCSSRSATPPASSARTTSATATSILPTVHGFDEFFGNLYHLNAEEEPELFNYPQDPRFRQKFGPRGVLRCKATDKDDPTVDPRWGKVGKQTIEDTGPLTRKRMETIDDETSAAAIDFIQRQAKAGKPFFCLVQQHADALPHPRAARAPQPQGRDGPHRVRRRHGRARRHGGFVAQGAR